MGHHPLAPLALGEMFSSPAFTSSSERAVVTVECHSPDPRVNDALLPMELLLRPTLNRPKRRTRYVNVSRVGP